MVRRTARGYGNGSWKKAGRKGNERKQGAECVVRGHAAQSEGRGDMQHAICD